MNRFNAEIISPEPTVQQYQIFRRLNKTLSAGTRQDRLCAADPSTADVAFMEDLEHNDGVLVF